MSKSRVLVAVPSHLNKTTHPVIMTTETKPSTYLDLMECVDITQLKTRLLSEYILPLSKQLNHPDFQFLMTNYTQILEADNWERCFAIIKKLMRAEVGTKSKPYNDIDLNKWQNYSDILTHSLWMVEKRDRSSTHNSDYWGNFIPQIPNQLLQRFTQKEDWVLDPFLGSGTTLLECRALGRNGIGIEIQEEAAVETAELIADTPNPEQVNTYVEIGDSQTFPIQTALDRQGIKSVQLMVLHPPYWNVVPFGDNENNLANAFSSTHFLDQFELVVHNCTPYLEDNRYAALIIGDIYMDSEWVPLAFQAMQRMQRQGYTLKSTVIKNVNETKGKRDQTELWRYRALNGGFYVFKHEYIFLFQKT